MVPINKHSEKFLCVNDTIEDDDDIATDFDLWIHQSLLSDPKEFTAV
jgi:hypothetical protein